MRTVSYQTEIVSVEGNITDLVFVDFELHRLCIIAGNISPIDVITHVPILCEESNIPYIYVPTKEVSIRHIVFHASFFIF